MTNNDIFKKLRVALQLRDDQIVEILSLVDFRISKGEIGNFFRSEDHPKYVECQDQVLRNFLNGLVIYLRGTKENPKDPKEVLQKIKETKSTEKTVKPKPMVKPTTMRQKSKPTKKEIMGNVKFNNGKQNKKD